MSPTEAHSSVFHNFAYSESCQLASRTTTAFTEVYNPEDGSLNRVGLRKEQSLSELTPEHNTRYSGCIS